MPLTPGACLGPYEIVAALGSGGMGEVYKSRDTRLDRIVALKVLPSELAADPDRHARFEREARAIGALSHPHICVVHDVGRDGNVDYLVMEHLSRQPLAPQALDALVAGCLDKDPDERWQSAGDLKRNLLALPATVRSVETPQKRRTSRVLSAAGAVILIALASLAAWRYDSPAGSPAVTTRFEVFPPATVSLAPSPIASAAQLAVSPDGRRLAFVAALKHGSSQVWVRRIDSLESQVLNGTEGASYPFWSPDSRFIAFFAGGKLKKVDVTGGPPQIICDVVSGRGGTWSSDGTIVFAGEAYSPLSQVRSAGGAVTRATAFDAGHDDIAHYWPEFLSDGRHFLFFQRSTTPAFEGIYVGSLDSGTKSKVLDVHARAVHSAGRLFYVRDGTLFAQAFDERRLEVSGDPVRVGDNVGYFQSSYGYAAITASLTGTVAYGPSVAPTTRLEWRDRSGTAVGPAVATGVYTGPRLSADGKLVAASLRESGTQSADIWVLDVARRNSSRITNDPLNDWFPAWSSDAGRLFFGSTRAGSSKSFQKIGVNPEERLIDSGNSANYPNDVSNDGRMFLYTLSSPAGYDLIVASLDGGAKSTPFVAGPSNEVQGRFSPDGRWVAYASDESGEYEVYVRPFPASDNQWKISTAGGMQPEWRHDGKELFYVAGGKMMAVDVASSGPIFVPATPHPLFNVDAPEAVPPYPGHYAVAADGQRFLINTAIDPDRPLALTVVTNWMAAIQE